MNRDNVADMGRCRSSKGTVGCGIRGFVIRVCASATFMRVDDGQCLSGQRQPWLPERPVPVLAPEAGLAALNSARFDSLELESLVLNLDASLRMRARHQFFNWTQGSPQSLIEHQVLICALRDGGAALFHVDSFSTLPVGPAHFNEMFRQDVSLVPHLIKAWEDNH